MKSFREELWVETKSRRAYINITLQVEAAIRNSGVQDGLVLVNAMHITASVYINDDESGLLNLETAVGSQKSAQVLGTPGKIKKCLITTEVTTTFCISPCTPTSYTSLLRPAVVSRLKDYDEFLEKLAPHDGQYRHNDTGEDNGDAHIKRQIMGRALSACDFSVICRRILKCGSLNPFL